jgi:hypothetical protein
VFEETPGAAVYRMICINCHGPKADSQGRLAQNLATMTGGNALVADFRDGLFGPPGSMDANLHRVFGASGLPAGAGPEWTQGTDEDRAARYLAWMGLGGTAVNIPVEILAEVAITKVAGYERVVAASSLSANMLSQAKALCQSLLGAKYGKQATYNPGDGHGYLDAHDTNLNDALIFVNGDAELWLHMCALNNPSPVHVLELPAGEDVLHVLPRENAQFQFTIDIHAMVHNDVYPRACGNPTDCQVGNERGGVDATLTDSNLWPWCVDDSTASATQESYLSANNIPRCPQQVQQAITACEADLTKCFDTDAGNAWAVRGAINAGLSVFKYVKSIEDKGPPPDYNECPASQ